MLFFANRCETEGFESTLEVCSKKCFYALCMSLWSFYLSAATKKVIKFKNTLKTHKKIILDLHYHLQNIKV
jgi:hypothetical protein